MRNTLFLFLLSLLAYRPVFADDYPRTNALSIQHYRFELTLTDKSDELVGHAFITILIKKDSVNQLRLDLLNQTQERKGRGMQVDSVQMGGTRVSFHHQNDILLVDFPKFPAMGSVLVIEVSYHGIPMDGLKIGPTKFGARSFFSENWPNKARHWLPTIDHPYYKATLEFVVRAPAHYQVVSNGLLVENSLLDSATRLTHWKQSVPVSCWLFVLGVAEFAVQYPDTYEGKSIQTWVYPQNREAGFYDFGDITYQVVKFFSGYIGPYAYEKIANIQSPSISGGMETSSAIFYAENLVNGKRDIRLRNVIIHELAHQWFGNAVTETTWDNAWLSEGFATFFTLLFIENTYGHDEYVKGLISARKTVYDAAAKDPGFSIIANRSAEKGPVTSGITYQKGAWVLHMLREKMGEANFQKGIQSYYARYMNENTTTGDFRTEMERASGMDLGKFFDQWLYHPENPVLKGSWKYDPQKKLLRIHLEQTQGGETIFDLPLELGILFPGDDKLKIIKWNIHDRQVDQSFSLEATPMKVTLDPRTVLLSMIDFAEEK